MLSLALGTLLGLALGPALPGAALAEASDLSSRVQVSGFGTLGGSYSSRDDLHPLREWGQPDTFNGHWSWKMDSLVGVQVNARLTSQIDAAVQVVLKDRAIRTFEQSLELAFIGWRPTPESAVRVGRLGLDFYLLSDYRNVSYAYLWERPPIELYGPALPMHFDGVDATYRHPLAGGDLTLKLFWGSTEHGLDFGPDLGGAQKARIDPLWGGRLLFERGSWRLSAGFGHLTSDGDFDFLTETGLLPALSSPLLQMLWPEAGRYAAELRSGDRTTTFTSIGAAYDDGTWQISGEAAYVRSEYALLRDTLSGYLSVGRRFGSLTPYLVLAAARPTDDLDPVTPPSDPAIAYAPGLKLLYEGIDDVYGRLGTDQETLSLGVRWDLSQKLALKAQWDHTRTRAYDMWRIEESLGHRSQDELDLFSLSLSWVF